VLEARHEAYADAVRAAVEPIAELHDPRRVVAQLGGAGVLAACVPRAFGGHGDRVEVRSLVAARLVLGEVHPLADTMFAMQGLGSFPVTIAGSLPLKKDFLPRVADGSLVCGFAVTEPEAGSDVGSMQTRAVRDADGYLIDGEKVFISNAGLAHRYVLFARTSDDRKRGLSAFLVEADRPGIEAEPLRLLGDHPIGRLRLRGLRVPHEALLGEEGDGLGLALFTLDFFRTTVGAAATGMAARGLIEAKARARARRQFGKALAEFQATQLAIADMAVDVTAARLLCLDAAAAIDRHLERPAPPPLLPRALGQKAAMAKLFATEAAQRTIDRALQLWGGAGLIEGTPVERLYREVRALRIYEGTSEIQRLVIARAELES
jgi:acyl-CoA dehydrogenase